MCISLISRSIGMVLLGSLLEPDAHSGRQRAVMGYSLHAAAGARARFGANGHPSLIGNPIYPNLSRR